MNPTALPFDPALANEALLDQLITSLHPTTVAPTKESTLIPTEPSSNPFFDSLRTPILQIHEAPIQSTPSTKNLALTENGGVTNLSTLSPTLDLFHELSSVRNPLLADLLAQSWKVDPLETLKIIFSARSIPRGKGEKEAWTRGMSWLAEFHPQTMLRNLEQVVRPVDRIPKRKKKEEGSSADKENAQEEDGDLCVVGQEVEAEIEEALNASTARSHGYYKDLLNLLVLSSLPSSTTSTGSELSVEGDYTRVPGMEIEEGSRYTSKRRKVGSLRSRGQSPKLSNEPREDCDVKEKDSREEHVQTALSSTAPTFHRALHLLVANIFARQLTLDRQIFVRAQTLEGEEAYQLSRTISLAAKWAPSEGSFFDEHSHITSSIAEILTPLNGNRTSASLVYSLSVYRTKYLVPLRQHLEIVERKMSSNEWDAIKYNRVPSIAMDRNKRLFGQHDAIGFGRYLGKVVDGTATISGAALTPGGLLAQASRFGTGESVEALVVESQWKALVQSIKDAGNLQDCVAVADVSGSMMSPQLSDGTCPMHSSVALALLISRVTKAPFANSIITFSDEPVFLDLDPTGTLTDVSRKVTSTGVGYSTDFMKVFRLILSRALENKLAADGMIKRVFVFSDMEYNQAEINPILHVANSVTPGTQQYSTHFEILKAEFSAAGYELPELVFWNLAARVNGKGAVPVTSETTGACLVGGYSAAIVKAFLDGVDFSATEKVDEMEQEEIEVIEVNEKGEEVTKQVKKKMDPMAVMREIIGHASFEGLKVWD